MNFKSFGETYNFGPKKLQGGHTPFSFLGSEFFFLNFPETLDSERGGIDVHRSAGFKTLELSSGEIWRSHLQPMPF